jgi:hypothetical protein
MSPELSDLLPTTVVEIYDQARGSKGDVRNRWRALYVTPEHMLRVAVLPILVRVLTSNEPLSRQLRRILLAFSVPTFSTWKWLGDTLAGKSYDDFDWGVLGGYRSSLKNAMAAINGPLAIDLPSHYCPSGGERTQSFLGLFMAVRNFAAHSSFVSVSTCQRDLETFLPVLKSGLTHFRFFEHFRYCADGYDLHGPMPLRLKGRRRASVALRTATGEDFRISPYAFAAGTPRRLEVFDGYRVQGDPVEREVAYQTRHGRKFRNTEAVGHLDKLFQDNSIVPLPGLKYLYLDSFAQFARRVTEDNLIEMKAQYDPDLFVERSELTAALKDFSNNTSTNEVTKPNAVLLTGAPGAGKSALLAWVARELLRDEVTGVLLIRGHKCVAGDGSQDILFQNLLELIGAQPDERKKCRSFPDFLIQLNANAADSKFRLVILFDAVNEVPNRPEAAYLEFLGLVTAASRYRWVRLIGTVREDFVDRFRSGLKGASPDPSHDIKHLLAAPPPGTPVQYRVEGRPWWMVPSASHEERKAIYERFRARKRVDQTIPACLTAWDDLDRSVRCDILDRPLLIRLWMTAYDDRAGGKAHRASDVYVEYLNSLSPRYPHLVRTVLPRVIDCMLRAGRAALSEQDANGQLADDLKAVTEAGLFEMQVPVSGPSVFRVFHDRLGEALAARRLRELLCLDSPEASGPEIDSRRLAHWDPLPRRSDNQLLFGGLELFIRRLMDVSDWRNVAKVLEHIDFQMPPASSWLFLAGRQKLSIELRETLHPHLDRDDHKQINLYQLGLAYTRDCDYDTAELKYEGAALLGGSQQMQAAIAMYRGVNFMGINRVSSGVKAVHLRGRLANAEKCLKKAMVNAEGTALEGNVYGHQASLMLRQVEAGGRCVSTIPRDEQAAIMQLYKKAIELNQQPDRTDGRSTVYWLTELGRAQLSFNQSASAERTFIRARELCESQGLDAKCHLDLHARLGELYYFMGKIQLAEQYFRTGLKLAMDIGDGEMEEMLEHKLLSK